MNMRRPRPIHWVRFALAVTAWLGQPRALLAQGAPFPQAPLPQQQAPQPGAPQAPFPQQQVPQPGVPQAQFPQQQFPVPSYVAPPSNKRSGSEITVLYGTAAVYGVGVGVWFGAEAKI